MLRKAKNICELFIIILALVLNTCFVKNTFNINILLFILTSIVSIILIQFLYGFILFRTEKYINKYSYILLLLFYGIILLIINHSNILINVINMLSFIYSLYISSKFTSIHKGNHASLFLMLTSLIIYPALFSKCGSNLLLSLLIIPLIIIYLYQFYYIDKKEDKINYIIPIIMIITVSILNIISYESLPSFNYLFMNYIVNICLIIYLLGIFYKFTVNFNKIKYMTLLLLLLYLIINNNIFIVLAMPLLLLSYILSLDEKWELIHISKYFIPKDIKKVSVVIPNYNYANYIEKRIDSVLNQTYPIYELIILDDKSTDNSDEIIKRKVKEVKEKYKNLNIRYIPNKLNSGSVFKQWTKAFEESTGDYVWIAEADDLCSKYFLNTVMKKFKDKDVVLSYAESTAIDEYGNKTKNDLRNWVDVFHDGRWNESFISDGKKHIANYLCVNNSISNASGVVFKKDDNIPFKKYLKGATEFKLSGDWYFYSKVLLHGKIAYSSESLNYHRIHSKSVTNTTKKKESFEELLRIHKSAMNDVEVSKKALKKMNDYKNMLEDKKS